MKKKKNNAKVILLLIFIILIFVGAFAAISMKAEKTEVSPKNKDYSYKEYDDFLKDCFIDLGFKSEEDAEPEPIVIDHVRQYPKKYDIEKIETAIWDYLEKEGIDSDRVGIAFYDMASDSGFGINQDVPFLAASTMKVPINVYTYDLLNEGVFDLSQTITYYENYDEGGTGIIQFEPYGTEYSLREILRLSIVESDNIATNMLYSLLGNYGGYYLLDQLHDIYGISSSEGNYITPGEALNSILRVYNGRGDVYSLLYEDMGSTVGNDFATYYFNEDEGVHHKKGNYDGYYNDLVIVDGENPFFFTIYTNNLESPIERLQDLGEIIYDGAKR